MSPPDTSTLLQWVLIEEEERARRQRAEIGPRFDWYGEPCGCSEANLLEDGSCRVHPRARDKQRPPEGDWLCWLMLMGRGSGKTRSGAEWLRWNAEKHPGFRFALVGQQAADVRDIMIEGESGIMAISPPWFRPKYVVSKRRLEWPNGTIALCYSAEEPDQFRGPQFHGAWADELAKWPDPELCWDNLQFGLRLGVEHGWTPQTCVTTTPLPIPLIKRLIKDPDTKIVRGSTFENIAHLAKSFIAKVRKDYEGTRLGRQELHAEVLDDNPHALWSTEVLDGNRVKPEDAPEMYRIVVVIDPSVNDPSKVADESKAAECGITVSGIAEDGRGYLLEDCSVRDKPTEWAKVAIAAFHRHSADRIVAEGNNGGAMIASLINILDDRVPVTIVHASKGKATRSEPISALYEQGRICHVGYFPELEEQLVTWMPGMKSPDRLDSLVWGMTELMMNGAPLEASEAPWGEWRGT